MDVNAIERSRYRRDRDCRCDTCRPSSTLFDLPHEKPRMRAATPAARYARYTPRRRVLCDDCVKDIHVRGIAVAPPPRGVRWKRTDADGTQNLCEQHKDRRQETERA